MFVKQLIGFMLWTSIGPSLAGDAVHPAELISAIRSAPQYKHALQILSRDHDRLVSENIELTEIPAPPFKEEAKANVYRQMLGESGLANVEMDAEGNVIGVRKGRGDGSLVAVAAHLDTVFPESTDVKVKRDGTKLRAPGIADDTRGLAALLAILRAMDEAKIETDSDILFIASVGEEGLGDLRGVKHLFLKGPYKDKIKTFIALDGVDAQRLVTTAVGSRRYRVTFSGPGGHSYSAFGTVNPMYAMGGFLTQFGTIKVPPLTTYSVGVTGGGTSVNAIPLSTWLEIDMRSTEPSELDKMEARMREMASAATAAENETRSTKNGAVAVKIELIGDRPAGSTTHPFLGLKQPAAARLPDTSSRNSHLVEFAWEAINAQGLQPVLDSSSTDANIAMSLGIPAITLSAGVGGRIHSLDEWLDVDKDVSLRQMDIALTTILAAAGARL
jgi:tripeptide aminopeptidase